MPKFEKGQSGNPAGRRRGTGHAAKLRKAIEKDMPGIVEAMVASAKDGDTSAAKLLLDRVVPTIKPVQQLVLVNALQDKTLSEQGSTIIAAMSSGSLAPEQATTMLAGLASLAKIREADQLEQRIAALEAAHSDD
jgi:hypothetical protein